MKQLVHLKSLFVGANALSMIRHVHWATSSAKTTNHNPLKTQIRSLLTLVCAASASLLIIPSPAQAGGYIVTLQQVGPNVVATGSGAIDLTGLTHSGSFSLDPQIQPCFCQEEGSASIFTGPTSSSVDRYFEARGPRSFGSGPFTSASSGSGDMVGITTTIFGDILWVPTGYVSGTALSDMAIYSGKTLASLGVTPGTYVWTWGTGSNQNFTLQIRTPGPTSTAIWYLNNNAFVAGARAPTLPVGWIVVGVADFNGDSHPDYLLYNTSTNQTKIWYLNNNVFFGGASGPTLPANWNVVGVADFDGDGRPDYLLFSSTSHQTAIWYLSGTSFVRGAFGPSLPNGWDLVAGGDFNADGQPDYVLYAPATRQTAIWYLNNNAFVDGDFGPTLPVNWRVVGVSDFNGDNKPDYLLFNSSTHQTAIWYLSGPTLVGGAFGPTIASGYPLIGAADFNADGKPDYLLYNASTR